MFGENPRTQLYLEYKKDGPVGEYRLQALDMGINNRLSVCAMEHGQGELSKIALAALGNSAGGYGFDPLSSQNLITELLALEEHEAMRMVQSSNCLEDI